MKTKTNTFLRQPHVLLTILFALSGFFRAQGQSPIGHTDMNIGVGFSHTTYKTDPSYYAGEGLAGHIHTSLIGWWTDLEAKHRLVLGDYLGADLFMGGREYSEPTVVYNSDGNQLGKHFYWGGAIEFGFQGYFRIIQDLDIGAKLYYSAIVDNTRIRGNTGNDDNQVIKIQGRYKRIMIEYGYKTKSLLFFKSTKESLTQDFHSICIKYFFNLEKKYHVGIKWDRYSDPGLYFDNIQHGGFESENIRIFYGMMF
ncbi:MAG TPA: hypothetical protein VGO45_06865 [Bacteroidia bacterium]|jgi:hypothetical protein|nr:hypothetical protein [Bacteroidia bacterium]